MLALSRGCYLYVGFPLISSVFDRNAFVFQIEVYSSRLHSAVKRVNKPVDLKKVTDFNFESLFCCIDSK
jgi:hypothetical protein